MRVCAVQGGQRLTVFSSLINMPDQEAPLSVEQHKGGGSGGETSSGWGGGGGVLCSSSHLDLFQYSPSHLKHSFFPRLKPPTAVIRQSCEALISLA